MLYLLFQVKETLFALDTTYVVEIIHRVHPIEISDKDGYFEGLINYRGELIPLLDFCQLYSGQCAQPYIHSRIIVLESLDERKIGVLAECVMRTVEVHRNDFMENISESKKAQYISGMWNTGQGFAKNVDIPLLFHICYEGAING